MSRRFHTHVPLTGAVAPFAPCHDVRVKPKALMACFLKNALQTELCIPESGELVAYGGPLFLELGVGMSVVRKDTGAGCWRRLDSSH